MIILEWFNVHFEAEKIPILEWLHPNVPMLESESLDGSTHRKKKKNVFVYLSCSMVTYHIHMGKF